MDRHVLRLRISVPTLACAAAVSCSTPTAPGRDTEPLVATDADRYAVTYDGAYLRTEIPYVFENRTGSTVYLAASCDGSVHYALERRVGTTWRMAWDPPYTLCAGPPIEVADGDTYQATASVYGGPPGSEWYPHVKPIDASSVYRLVWTGALIGGARVDIVSNRFELDPPEAPRRSCLLWRDSPLWGCDF